MDFDIEGALKELGLGIPTSLDDIRAAYLRLLKVRKPDSDPEGFMRLRAAYERLQAGDTDFVSAPASTQASADHDGESPEPRDGQGRDVGEPEDVPETTFLEGALPLEALKPRLQAYLESLRRQSFTMIERIEVLDAVQQQHPEDADLAEWLALEFVGADQPGLAAELLTSSIGKVPPAEAARLWRILYQQVPWHWAAHGLLTLPTTVAAPEVLAAAERALAKESDGEVAAALLRKVLAGWPEQDTSPYSSDVLRLAMGIGAAGFLLEVFHLLRDFGGRLGLVELAIANEWLVLDGKLPPGVMRSLCKAVLRALEGQHDVALELDVPPHTAGEAVETIRTLAPRIHGLVPNRGARPITYLDVAFPAEGAQATPRLVPARRVAASLLVPPRPRPKQIPNEEIDLGTPIAEVFKREPHIWVTWVLLGLLAVAAFFFLWWGFSKL